MAFTSRRPKASPERPAIAAPAAQTSPPDAVDGELVGPMGQDVPPHVWTLLQEAGELAAERLVSILRGNAFMSYAPTAQKALIELALTRAYGLPVRKALNVNLSTSDADAVAASLADLGQNLPEHAARQARQTLDGLSGSIVAEHPDPPRNGS